MWILLLAVASFLAFVSIVLSLCVANALEARKTFRKSEIHVGPSFAVLSITQAFEPVSSVPWEAPIQALELIQSGGTRGIPVSRLRSTFNEAAARLPEIWDGRNLSNGSSFSKTPSSFSGPDSRSYSPEKVASSSSTSSRQRP
jgi:hypothetical protein